MDIEREERARSIFLRLLAEQADKGLQTNIRFNRSAQEYDHEDPVRGGRLARLLWSTLAGDAPNTDGEIWMSKATRATKMLADAGVAFTIHTYDYDPTADRIGIQAADALGEQPERVLKTLMALVDGKPVCVIVPSDREVAMKKLAAAFGGKAAQMMKPADAERITGYKVGGISPFGQMRAIPTAIDAAALVQPQVYINGGQRGLQLRIDPRDAARVTGALAATLIA